jgi:alpha-tubulin suppressor-like RCC1 family protein
LKQWQAAVVVSVVVATIGLTNPIVGSTATADHGGDHVWSTGLNADGQLGDGTTTSRLTPAPILRELDIRAIASGREHGYALDSTGRVYAWGDNSKRAIGDGSSLDRPTPVQLSLTGVVQIEAGHYHGIALRNDGTVWTWGYGGLGQLGLGTRDNRATPTQVPGLGGIVSVAAGRDMSYALRSDGTVLGWGGNTYGEVGDGTTTRRTSPVAVIGLTDVVEISGGRNHALVVRADGSIWAWGANERGQLGVGSTVNQNRPVAVLTSSVRHVDAGAEHGIAVMVDGTVRTWGRGYRGQLGLGTTASRTVPTPVPGLSGVVEVGDGRDQSFAMNALGEVWAWGFNDTGQLGDGTTTTRLVPVRVPGLTGIVSAQGGRGMTLFLAYEPSDPVDPDVTPPSVPGTPSATSNIGVRVDLEWAASVDDTAQLLTYFVYRDGGSSPVASIVSNATGTISYADTAVTSGSVHTYEIAASDGVNVSARSAPSAPVTVYQPTSLTLLEDNFSNGLSAWVVNGPLVVDGALGSSEPPSIRANVTGAAADMRRSLTSTGSDVCASLDVRVASMSGSVRYSLLKLRNSQGASIGRLEVDAAGRVSVRADVVGTVLRTDAVLPLSTWRKVTLCATVGLSGRLRAEVDGAEVGNWSTNTGTQLVSGIQIGDNSARTAVVNFDDVVVAAGS